MKAIVEQLEFSDELSFRVVRRRDSAFSFHWHCHPEYELTLIECSAGRRFVGDSIEEYQVGDLVLLGPGLPHSWVSHENTGDDMPQSNPSGGDQAVVVQFAEDCFGSDFFELPEMKLASQALSRANRGLCFESGARDQVGMLIAQLDSLPPLKRLSHMIHVLDLLGQAVVDGESHDLASPGFRPTLHRSQQQRIDVVCRYINNHYTNSLEQVAVAGLIDMKPAQFSHFFKRSTGRTFVHYVNTLRVGHACRLLIETELSITDICFRSGFSNLSNFNRRFKATYDQSPRQYRLLHATGSA